MRNDIKLLMTLFDAPSIGGLEVKVLEVPQFFYEAYMSLT